MNRPIVIQIFFELLAKKPSWVSNYFSTFDLTFILQQSIIPSLHDDDDDNDDDEDDDDDDDDGDGDDYEDEC